MNIPTLQINNHDLQQFVRFIYKHEPLLKEFGAIKVQPTIDCQLALKKRPKKSALCRSTGVIMKMSQKESIYVVQRANHTVLSTQLSSLVTDECSFWSSLSSSSSGQRQLNTSMLPDTSFFAQKTSRLNFDIHRLPYQSLLKIGGNRITRQFVPCVQRAYRPGAIFPLASAQQRLLSINYHHEGGARHWYIIPTREREAVRKIIGHQHSSICLDHGQLLVDPSVLNKYSIRYHHTIQYPNEFIVLSAGALAQSFTEDASWSESIAFALPSWIEEGYAHVSAPLCQCDIFQRLFSQTIDINLFKHKSIQRFISVYLNTIAEDKSKALEGQ
jgi:hypothetical protein